MAQERILEEGYYRLSHLSRDYLAGQGIDPNQVELARLLVRSGKINEGPGFIWIPPHKDTFIARAQGQDVKSWRSADYLVESFPTVSRNLTDLANLCVRTEKKVCKANIKQDGEPSKLLGQPWQDRQFLDKQGSCYREIQLLAFAEPAKVKGLRLQVSYYCSLYLIDEGQFADIDGLRLCFYDDDRIEMIEGRIGLKPSPLFDGQSVQTVYLGLSVNLNQEEWHLVSKAQAVLREYLGE